MQKTFEECLLLFEDRNKKGYRDSWLGRTGLRGVFAQIERKTDRLYAEVWETNGQPPDVAAVIDAAKDNIVYNALLIILLKEMQKDGYAC